ncbi:hypothetical protein JD844_007156 [Phrynosoma platyrhinos]|uniref:DDE Tnp4 domain-containing protein n=1 Tax=Phrynosoma platyrhinos TaxID=52577 RepID=A0ABQ7T363_PHRPL|nr:hypothetical protein JD844_007156 [Phrynosoma platyrhinos]
MWKHEFCMLRRVFYMIVEELQPCLRRQDTHLHQAISVEKWIAIAVYMLAHQDSYSTVATHFGVGKSTVCKAFIQVVTGIELVLMQKTVYLGDHRKSWVMTPFKGVLHPHQSVYNKQLNKMRYERAFGCLKARWTAPLEVAEENVNSIIAASVKLHNIVDSDGKGSKSLKAGA